MEILIVLVMMVVSLFGPIETSPKGVEVLHPRETRSYAPPRLRGNIPRVHRPTIRRHHVARSPAPTLEPAQSGPLHVAKYVTWYGPSLWGNRMACGKILRKDTVGLGHVSLPCGTMIRMFWKNHVITLPVVDRGKAVASDRVFDMTRAGALRFGGLFTKYNVEWKIIYGN